MFIYPSRQTSFGVAFSTELRKRNVTTLVNLEFGASFGQPHESPAPSISRMIDSGIWMRPVGQTSEIRRMISVLKHRQSWFDSTIRQFTIEHGGIVIGNRLDAVE